MADSGRSETPSDERADELANDTPAGVTGSTDSADSTDTAADSTDTATEASSGADSGAPADGTADETAPGKADESADEKADEVVAGTTDTDDTDDRVDTDDEDEDDEGAASERPWALVAATAVAALAVVALAVTAFLVPGWAVKPGSPDSVAQQATAALAAKDPARLDAVSCRDQQGAPTNPFPPDALALIQQATPAGPPVLELDTQARAPVDLVLSAQGQTQQLPADLVLGVTDGQWCMAGISQRA